jgi:hypothetical protein
MEIRNELWRMCATYESASTGSFCWSCGSASPLSLLLVFRKFALYIPTTLKDLQYIIWGGGGGVVNVLALRVSRATAYSSTYFILSNSLVAVFQHIRIHGYQHLPFPAVTSCVFSRSVIPAVRTLRESAWRHCKACESALSALTLPLRFSCFRS